MSRFAAFLLLAFVANSDAHKSNLRSERKLLERTFDEDDTSHLQVSLAESTDGSHIGLQLDTPNLVPPTLRTPASMLDNSTSDAKVLASRSDGKSSEAWSKGFANMITTLQAAYPYTKHRKLDWDNLKSKYGARIIEAEDKKDQSGYFKVYKELIAEMRDGHCSASWNSADESPTCANENDDFDPELVIRKQAEGGSFGVLFAKDGRSGNLRITFVREGLDISPFRLWDVIDQVQIGDGAPSSVTDHLDRLGVPMWAADPATDKNIEIAKIEKLSRGPIGSKLKIGGPEGSTTLTAVEDNLAEQKWVKGYGWVAGKYPKSCVASKVLPGKHGYLQVGTFHSCVAMGKAVKSALAKFKKAGVNDLIVDLRGNGGGDDTNVPDMFQYFFDKPYQYEQTVVPEAKAKEWSGDVQEGCDDCGKLVQKDDGKFMRLNRYKIKPADKADRWTKDDGKVVVMINRAIMSNGDMAVHLFKKLGADIVGNEGTSGSASMAGGKIKVPCVAIDFTACQSWDTQNNIQVETNGHQGGTEPTKPYPTSEEAVLAHTAWLAHHNMGTPLSKRPKHAKVDPMKTFALSLLGGSGDGGKGSDENDD